MFVKKQEFLELTSDIARLRREVSSLNFEKETLEREKKESDLKRLCESYPIRNYVVVYGGGKTKKVRGVKWRTDWINGLGLEIKIFGNEGRIVALFEGFESITEE